LAWSRHYRRTKIKDDDVIQALTQDGISLDRWLAIDVHLVGYFDETGRLMLQIFEDDALSSSASKMLQKRGQIHENSRVDKPF
jgi:Icc-related predicted phosphoesterase